MEAITIMAIHAWYIPENDRDDQTRTPVFLSKVRDATLWVNNHRSNLRHSEIDYFKERRQYLFHMLKSGFTSIGTNRNVTTGKFESLTFMEVAQRETDIRAMDMVARKRKLTSVYAESMASLVVQIEEEGAEDVTLVDSLEEPITAV